MALLNYIAILGRQPEFGLVELESLVGTDGVEEFGRHGAILDQELEIDRLGGILKIGKILYRGPETTLRDLPIELADLPMRETKTPFAISTYGFRETPKMLMAAGLELKKRLRERGSVRLVTAARGLAATAAELRHNRVLEDGFELLVVSSGNEMVVARTSGVQNIDWYSRRDYDRPARSAKIGMLPPKLAQILVNTTKAGIVIDPFCGTGVILQEARLLGRASYGSDLAPEMVAATRLNMPWLDQEVAKQLPDWDVQAGDAREIVLPEGCAVVTEGYLGPNMQHSPTRDQLNPVRGDLLVMYKDSLRNWAGQLPAGAEVSMCVPVWRIGREWHYLGLIDELADLGYTPKSFRAVRTPLLYARADQVVGRQLLLLRKN